MGIFGVYGIMPPEKCQDFMYHLMENLVRMADHVTEGELEKAKTQLKVLTLFG